jgi:hypothetical protein
LAPIRAAISEPERYSDRAINAAASLLIRGRIKCKNYGAKIQSDLWRVPPPICYPHLIIVANDALRCNKDLEKFTMFALQCNNRWMHGERERERWR